MGNLRDFSQSTVVRHSLCVRLICLLVLPLCLIGVRSQPPAAPSPRGSASGRYLPLQDREKIAQLLPPAQFQIYTFKAPPANAFSITVSPCQGKVSWNVTHAGARLFTHPNYGKRRKRRQITGGVTHNFNFARSGMVAGLGTSMGEGAITFSNAGGGLYYMELANTGPSVAHYEMYATLQPQASPYVQLPDNPQVQVTAIRDTELAIAWTPIPGIHKDVIYCIEFHRSENRRQNDVQSSSCASHRFRHSVAKQETCVPDPLHTIQHLRPSTQYSIDVFARNRTTNSETAYLSVTASTAGAPPVPVHNDVNRVFTLKPHQTRVFSMAAPRRSLMLMGVSPCSGRLKWSILDSSGKSVHDYVQAPAPGVQKRPAALTSATQRRRFTNSLPSADHQVLSNVAAQGRVSIAVSNLNPRQTASFEVYAAVNQHRTAYPIMPGDRQVTPETVMDSSVTLSWQPVSHRMNITYCVHIIPHNKALQNNIVHSACGLSLAEQRRVISGGRCLPTTRRTVTGLTPNMWYDVDVVAKNTFSRRHQAYTGILVFTGSDQSQNFNNVGRLRHSAASCNTPRLAVVILVMAALQVFLGNAWTTVHPLLVKRF